MRLCTLAAPQHHHGASIQLVNSSCSFVGDLCAESAANACRVDARKLLGDWIVHADGVEPGCFGDMEVKMADLDQRYYCAGSEWSEKRECIPVREYGGISIFIY